MKNALIRKIYISLFFRVLMVGLFILSATTLLVSINNNGTASVADINNIRYLLNIAICLLYALENILWKKRMLQSSVAMYVVLFCLIWNAVLF